MKTRVMDYPPDGTLDDLSGTCNGDENAFGGPLVKLERVEDDQGKKATRATYEPVPIGEPYNKKELFFVDLGSPSPQPPGTDVVFGNADVYLNGVEAQVAVYRKQ